MEYDFSHINQPVASPEAHPNVPPAQTETQQRVAPAAAKPEELAPAPITGDAHLQMPPKMSLRELGLVDVQGVDAYLERGRLERDAGQAQLDDSRAVAGFEQDRKR
jgi:hypothetical protein